MGWNWAKENLKWTLGTFSKDWDQWFCGIKIPGEFVGALLLEKVQTWLDQIFEYNPTLAESKISMAARWKKWLHRSFPCLPHMSHAMYAFMRHTVSQTQVICYTFQPQNLQFWLSPLQKAGYFSRGWGLPWDLWLVYDWFKYQKWMQQSIIEVEDVCVAGGRGMGKWMLVLDLWETLNLALCR